MSDESFTCRRAFRSFSTLTAALLVNAAAIAAAAQPLPAEAGAVAWTPGVATTWQLQLTGPLNTQYDVDVYDVDLYDTSTETIEALHAQGRRVVCYFSAGSAEDWREDYDRFLPADLGKPLDGWAGERWVDTRSANVRAIMADRMDLARAKGCDGVDPDNVDGYSNPTGLPLSAATQLDYNRTLAAMAHERDLAVGLKNDVDQLAALAPHFDFAVNEQCHQYSECGGYSAFTGADKPVFNVEYKRKWRNDAQARSQLCRTAQRQQLRTLVMPQQLNDRFRYSCDE